MALGRQGTVQDALLLGWHEVPSAPGHVFYDRLNAVLVEAPKGKRLGRPRVRTDEEGIREAVEGGLSIRKTAQRFGVSAAKVQRVLAGAEGA